MTKALKVFLIFSFIFCFNLKAEIVRDLPILLIINGSSIGDIVVDIKNNKKILKVDLSEVSDSLQLNFENELIDYLKKYNSNTKLANDIKIFFDHKDLSLKVSLPFKYYKKSHLNILYENNEVIKGIGPEDYSFYSNIRANYIKDNDESTAEVKLSPNLNLKSYLLEGDINYKSSSNRTIERGFFRIIKDDQKRALRYSIGDIQFSGISFMNQRPLGGVMLSKDFSITPNISTSPVGEKDFILNAPAKVSFFVNDSLKQVLNLNKGRYSATDFPLSDGINDLRIEILYYDGRKEILKFPYVTSFELLKKGLHQFNIATGAASSREDSSLEYGDDLTVSAFHRVGMTSQFNLSSFIQFDSKQGIIGFDSLLATSLGRFRFESALSKVKDNEKSGVALRLNYLHRNFNRSRAREREFGFQYQYFSPHFARLGTLDPVNLYPHVLNFNYRKQINIRSFASIGTSYLYTNDTNFDSLYRLNLGIQSSLLKRLNMSLTLSRNQLRKNTFEHAAVLFLNYTFEDNKHFSSLYHDTRSQSSRLNGRGNYQTQRGSYYSNITIEDNEKDNKVRGRMDYRHQRIDTYIDYEFVNSKKGDSREDHSIKRQNHNLRLGGAGSISYTRGHFGFGRPINGSFALISQEENLKNERITINPSEGGLAPRSDLLGNLLVSNMTPYQNNSIFIDTTELSEGVNYQNNNYNLRPHYKTGHLIRLKSTSNFSVFAKVYKENKEPLKLRWGKIISKDKNEGNMTSMDFFTDNEGRAFVDGLQAGHYIMKFPGDNSYQAQILLKNSKGPIDYGDIYVEKIEEE